MAFTNQDVMELRKLTNVGMMDCKKALMETDGDIEKAQVLLREKGMASAAKRADKVASQGVVDSYIHMGGNIGVLVEVNCETDFVARSDEFKAFAHDIALQIAATNPKFVKEEDVSKDFLEQEKEIAVAQAKNSGDKKPENVLAKIAEGKVKKILKEVCLMSQPFVKSPDKTIQDLLNEKIAAIGEKIDIRRFVRFEMGEGLEKKEAEDLSKEVEAQIAKIKK